MHYFADPTGENGTCARHPPLIAQRAAPPANRPARGTPPLIAQLRPVKCAAATHRCLRARAHERRRRPRARAAARY